MPAIDGHAACLTLKFHHPEHCGSFYRLVPADRLWDERFGHVGHGETIHLPHDSLLGATN
jgi:hypothetical protein